ncbi:hypothetical protein [Geobacter sp. OR-1]|uniref:hypothetical protein n=1 Tax=Geobacter sp. OR-1 TaxID=1266765 RepID=UPI0009DF356C|nr:hypothetical protein [Geobacter sp. OR-1]
MKRIVVLSCVLSVAFSFCLSGCGGGGGGESTAANLSNTGGGNTGGGNTGGGNTGGGNTGGGNTGGGNTGGGNDSTALAGNWHGNFYTSQFQIDGDGQTSATIVQSGNSLFASITIKNSCRGSGTYQATVDSSSNSITFVGPGTITGQLLNNTFKGSYTIPASTGCNADQGSFSLTKGL